MAVVVVVGIVVVLGLIAVVAMRIRTRGRVPVDRKARLLGTGKALEPLTESGARQKAEDCGRRLGMDEPPGVVIGTAVAGRRRLYGSYEDLHVDIWGTRQGKTTCRTIPAILAATGPVIATSAKRDVVDATRDVRQEGGRRIWVFDPEAIAGEAPTWFWDPLAWIGGDDLRATLLAGRFADAYPRVDSEDHHEIAAEELLAMLFLAASVARRPMVQIWDWVVNPQDTEPVEILRAAHRSSAGSALAAIYNSTAYQVCGIFSAAKKMIACLRLPNVHAWITPSPDRQQFDVDEFVGRNETLYALAAEGPNSVAPLVRGLVEAVLTVAAAQDRPTASPLLAVFDDVANLARWRDFPQRYGYYGSRGIVMMTMLQSWSQGVRCWGADGMSELWSAATVRVLGSGVDDMPFLRDRAEVLGSGTLTAADLRSLPRGRAIVFPSGAPPVLIETQPWWNGPYAAEVERSLNRHDPRRRPLFDALIFSRSESSGTVTKIPAEETHPSA
ncbi:type IV secretory system conjugative DNA transfer family protein [Nocardia terpenica]|uniref:type IV secretory system conjugative DNA transfer family protein n=1 Tax=Nocardia terpenica TaxID=455432 RepID=UPI0018953146|nr:TraM recognition domain-containing protein [Nocardia terpenica]MBF6059905.1 type IV secretory system conjugative DNA transfer family protein [Nocardia terpenica]MBF6102554.1 type IV secretory system conjugative DNA transfer family protein [Nocardia terpenica]MBF6111255.1 type IV secretory system conjugative DNA transfer family protein [Nocardia terpenica]MBF6117386.1 type IV secretory system conjugative DNA transfer family protein [Nocardia terpenica]MBF6150773.1 type IV secretory system co